ALESLQSKKISKDLKYIQSSFRSFGFPFFSHSQNISLIHFFGCRKPFFLKHIIFNFPKF
ncbi:unnamed protein product, partial [Arabidopsis halleri]